MGLQGLFYHSKHRTAGGKKPDDLLPSPSSPVWLCRRLVCLSISPQSEARMMAEHIGKLSQFCQPTLQVK